MASILEIAQEAADSGAIALQRPASLFAAYDDGDVSARRLLRAITQTCRDLQRQDWSILRTSHQWTCTATEAQAGGKPTTDGAKVLRYEREPATGANVFWSVPLGRRLSGPLDASQWETLTSGVSITVTPSWHEAGGVILIKPTPTITDVIRYRYIRDAVGRATTSADAAWLSKFAADANIALWDDELMVLGAIYHFRKAERMDYAQDERDYQLMKAERWKADGGARSTNMGGTVATIEDRIAAMRNAAMVVEIQT